MRGTEGRGGDGRREAETHAATAVSGNTEKKRRFTLVG